MANRQWALSPLPWVAWDAGPDDVLLRLVFHHAAPVAEPLAEVELLELPNAVIVTLYERNAGGRKLAAATSCVEVQLRARWGGGRSTTGSAARPASASVGTRTRPTTTSTSRKRRAIRGAGAGHVGSRAIRARVQEVRRVDTT